METRFEFKLRLSRPQKKAQTRDELLDAAARVFARQGYEAATLDQVAEAAGYTKGALYSSFPGKEALFLALMERRVETMGARVSGPNGPSTREEGSEETVDQQSWSIEWLLLAMEFWLYAMRHPEARTRMAAQYERFRGMAAEAVERRARDMGVELAMPGRDLVIVSEAIGNGLGIQYGLDPERIDIGLQRRAINRLVGFELLPEPARAPAPAPPEK
jgi:AcrR family transcriptional regulator